jgi:CubicO group peptidase (beta-lactamase class C family)
MSALLPDIALPAGLARAASPEEVGFRTDRLQRLVDGFAAHVEQAAIPGAVLFVARHGKVACLSAVGWRDRENADPMPLDAIFRGASITKPLTVAVALALVDDGLLQLAAPVSRYLPALANLQVGVEVHGLNGERSLMLEPAAREITIQDLMRHTAGFTYGEYGDSLVQRAYRAAHVTNLRQTNAEMVAKLATLPLAYQPGSTFEYGMSIDVLGAVIEAVAGMPFDHVIAERITDPLGMTDTGFRLTDEARLAVAQVDPLTGVRPDLTFLYDPAAPPAWFSGGGGILTTATDYGRFAQMLLNGGVLDGVRILGRKTVALMASDHLPPGVKFGPFTTELGVTAPFPWFGQGFGLGVSVRIDAGRAPHPGSVGDFSWAGVSGTYFWVDPAERLVAVLMLQSPANRVYYRSLLRQLVYQALT